MTEQEFINMIGPKATNDYKESGILASITVAQACLESGYGSTELAVNANNLFGMKTTLSGNTWTSVWDGVSKYTKKTQEEYTPGQITTITADFRKYPNIDNSIKDHSLYLSQAKNGSKLRYEGLIGEKNYKTAIQIIKDGGYATDSSYVSKICNLIERWNLTQYDKDKEGETTMGYTNSSLVTYTKLSPNHSGTRTHSIDRITPHCVVGQLSASGIAGCFTSSSVQASCNYGIGTEGGVALIVEEKNRSWCSSSNANDQRAVTIECASDLSAPYAFNSTVYNKLVDLCIDICKRNGKTKLLWLGDKNTTLNYTPASNEMVLTVHRWFANKSCPGDWMYERMGDLASQVTARLGGSSGGGGNNSGSGNSGTYKTGLYKVNVGDLNIRKGPGTNYGTNGVITNRGTYTITEIQNGSWGKLKSGAGWINISTAYCTYVGNSTGGSNSGGSNSSGTTYKTGTYKVNVSELNIRKGPGTNYGTNGSIKDKGVYTITEIKNGSWGRLKSDAGWINVDKAYCTYQGSSSNGGSSSSSTFQVQVNISDLYIRKGPGTSYGKNGFCPKGVYTITETKNANGYTWGKLKSGAGWIALEYVKRL